MTEIKFGNIKIIFDEKKEKWVAGEMSHKSLKTLKRMLKGKKETFKRFGALYGGSYASEHVRQVEVTSITESGDVHFRYLNGKDEGARGKAYSYNVSTRFYPPTPENLKIADQLETLYIVREDLQKDIDTLTKKLASYASLPKGKNPFARNSVAEEADVTDEDETDFSFLEEEEV
jgi:hypothetical protein